MGSPFRRPPSLYWKKTSFTFSNDWWVLLSLSFCTCLNSKGCTHPDYGASMESRIVNYRHYLLVSGVGNLRACCLPWMYFSNPLLKCKNIKPVCHAMIGWGCMEVSVCDLVLLELSLFLLHTQVTWLSYWFSTRCICNQSFLFWLTSVRSGLQT